MPGDQEPMKGRMGLQHNGQLPSRSSLGQIGNLVRFEEEEIVHHRIQVWEHLLENSRVAHTHLSIPIQGDPLCPHAASHA